MSPKSVLADWVSFPSFSKEEGEVADLAQSQLTHLGFETSRIKNNVVAKKGKGRKRLLLVSHLDVVPVGAGWTVDPFKTGWQDDKLIARGSNDAKGCAVAMTFGLALANDFDGEVTLVLAAEEENGGLDGVQLALSLLPSFDAGIVGEPTKLQVCTGQRGMLVTKFVAHGVSAHVAHSIGENAIHKAARDIQALEALRFPSDPILGEMRAQTVTIAGGEARNMVPDLCEFYVDVRTTPNVPVSELISAMDSCTESEMVVHSERYLAKSTPLDSPIFRAALRNSPSATPIGSPTVSDWAFLGDIPAVKVGPGDTLRSHTPNEYLLLSELEAGVEFYRKTIQSFFEETNG